MMVLILNSNTRKRGSDQSNSFWIIFGTIFGTDGVFGIAERFRYL